MIARGIQVTVIVVIQENAGGNYGLPQTDRLQPWQARGGWQIYYIQVHQLAHGKDSSVGVQLFSHIDLSRGSATDR